MSEGEGDGTSQDSADATELMLLYSCPARSPEVSTTRRLYLTTISLQEKTQGRGDPLGLAEFDVGSRQGKGNQTRHHM